VINWYSFLENDTKSYLKLFAYFCALDFNRLDILNTLCAAIGQNMYILNYPATLIIFSYYIVDMAIGQDLDSILRYAHSVDASPHGVMSYASLLNLANTSTALEKGIDYGSGTQWALELLNNFPESFLQLGLWMVGMCGDIAAGRMDDDVDALASFIGSLESNVFLRIGYEFDSSQNNYDTVEYVAAFRHIVNRFRHLHIDNVAFVWHASGFIPRDGLTIHEWFPGEEYVDWCGISFFQQPYSCEVSVQCDMKYAAAVAKFCKAKKHGIPLMIAESAPFGGIIDEFYSNLGPNRAGFSGSSWNAWFVPVMEFIEMHDVKMWSYISCNWDSQEQWQRERAPGVHWGDSRVQHFPGVFQRWVDEVIHNERYSWVVQASSAGVSPSRGRECPVQTVTHNVSSHQLRSLLIAVFVSSVFIVGAVWVFNSEYRNIMAHDYVTIP
jgi:hypothetical protein